MTKKEKFGLDLLVKEERISYWERFGVIPRKVDLLDLVYQKQEGYV